jgi:hypothetical protein
MVGLLGVSSLSRFVRITYAEDLSQAYPLDMLISDSIAHSTPSKLLSLAVQI